MEEAEKRNSSAEVGRARSVGSRSRSQGRVGLGPSELLARKQQLLSASEQAGSGSWSTNQEDEQLPVNSDSQQSHRRSQIRRARQTTGGGGGLESSRQSAIEAKLESLSELLKSHQQEEEEDNQAVGGRQEGEEEEKSKSKSIENVYILLAKKEKDLQLAAELGKALLEKNDELSKANERITEDYSHKLELLEQDKHKLKRKLDQLDGEYENRLIELQTDCNILKNQLEEQRQLARQKEKEKSKLIDDLVQQNQRLTSELVEATKSEELLSSQLEQMNERFNVRFSNRQDHVAQLDALKEEIQIVNQRKQDLERRLKSANNDKSDLQALLEESGDKILLLENLLNERDGKLTDLLEELGELKESSGWLASELESMISLNERLAGSSSPDELKENGGLEMVQRKRAKLLEQLKELRLRKQSRMKASEFIIMNRSAANHKPPARPNGTRRTIQENGQTSGHRRKHRDRSLFDEINGHFSPTGSSSTPEQDEEEEEEEEEVVDGEPEEVAQRLQLNGDLLIEIYAQLRHFQRAIQARKDSLQGANSTGAISNQQHLYSPNSTDDSGISADEIDKTVGVERTGGKQLSDPSCWRQLLESLKSLIEEMPCSTCYLMIAERADYEQLQKKHSRLSDELKRKEEELLAVSGVKLEQEARLGGLEEKCKILSDDLSNCDKPKEEIVKLAWKARDEAVERKNAAEISLAKTRIENMQISSQLMEVVQQKGELSQKLAQFEDDIHYITQDSVKAKFTWEEYVEKLRRTNQQESNNANSSLNPLAQLLSFSSNVVASTANKTTTIVSNANSNGTKGIKPAMDNLSSQSANLMRNFTSNRFNLRFWQKNSGGSNEKQDLQTLDNDLNQKGAATNNVTSSANNILTG